MTFEQRFKGGDTQGKSVPEEGKVNAKDLKWDYA